MKVTQSYGKTENGRVYYFGQYSAAGGKDFQAIKTAEGWELRDVSFGQPHGGVKVGCFKSPSAIRKSLFN